MVELTRRVTIGTTPVRAVYQWDQRTSLVIANMDSSAIIYYGSNNQVTTLTGIPIRPETEASFLEGLGDRPDLERWLVSDTLNTDVRIGEEPKKGKEVD